MNERGWNPPELVYRDKLPPNDDGYFENLTRVIFQVGSSWKKIEKILPHFKKAFRNLLIDKVRAREPPPPFSSPKKTSLLVRTPL